MNCYVVNDNSNIYYEIVIWNTNIMDYEYLLCYDLFTYTVRDTYKKLNHFSKKSIIFSIHFKIIESSQIMSSWIYKFFSNMQYKKMKIWTLIVINKF